MTKKNKILTICSVVGLLLFSYVGSFFTGNYWIIFMMLFDDEKLFINWLVILILGLITYFFLKKKGYTGQQLFEKNLWVIFVTLGFISLILSLCLLFVRYHLLYPNF